MRHSFLAPSIQAHWHVQKGAHNVPELLAVQAESNRVGRTRKDRNVSVRYRKLPEEVE
jgi:hypothetical protein